MSIHKLSNKTYVTLKWLEDPPAWDVIPLSDIMTGFNNVMDLIALSSVKVNFDDGNGMGVYDAKILQIGCQSKMGKEVARLRKEAKDKEDELAIGSKRTANVPKRFQQDAENDSDDCAQLKQARKNPAAGASKTAAKKALSESTARANTMRVLHQLQNQNFGMSNQSFVDDPPQRHINAGQNNENLPPPYDTVEVGDRSTKNYKDLYLKIKRKRAEDKRRRQAAEARVAHLQEQLNLLEDVDAEDGVQIEKIKIGTTKRTKVVKDRLDYIAIHKGSPAAYARKLLGVVFSTADIMGHSLQGKKCNANKEEPLPALDKRKVTAVLEHVRTFCNVKPDVMNRVVIVSLNSLIKRINNGHQKLQS